MIAPCVLVELCWPNLRSNRYLSLLNSHWMPSGFIVRLVLHYSVYNVEKWVLSKEISNAPQIPLICLSVELSIRKKKAQVDCCGGRLILIKCTTTRYTRQSENRSSGLKNPKFECITDWKVLDSQTLLSCFIKESSCTISRDLQSFDISLIFRKSLLLGNVMHIRSVYDDCSELRN